MATTKKITHVTGGETPAQQRPASFAPQPRNKSKATTLRVIAGVLWFLAVAAQIAAIALLFRPPVNMTWLVILIAVDLVLVVIGSMLWKKSNRLDPASSAQKFRFFMQNQLGLVAAAIAFVPLIIFVLTSKNIDKKQKGILGAVAGGALVVAGLLGADFNPPSAEEQAGRTDRVESLAGDHVYWTKSGTVYHLYDDCPYINTSRTDEIFEGTVAQARELKNITRVCSRCEERAEEARGLNADPAPEPAPTP